MWRQRFFDRIFVLTIHVWNNPQYSFQSAYDFEELAHSVLVVQRRWESPTWTVCKAVTTELTSDGTAENTQRHNGAIWEKICPAWVYMWTLQRNVGSPSLTTCSREMAYNRCWKEQTTTALTQRFLLLRTSLIDTWFQNAYWADSDER